MRNNISEMQATISYLHSWATCWLHNFYEGFGMLQMISLKNNWGLPNVSEKSQITLQYLLQFPSNVSFFLSGLFSVARWLDAYFATSVSRIFVSRMIGWARSWWTGCRQGGSQKVSRLVFRKWLVEQFYVIRVTISASRWALRSV